MRHTLAALSLGSILLPGLAAAATYGPRLSDADWQSVAGSNACHLVQELPRLGTVILSQYRDHRLVTTMVTRRPPAATQEGRLYREATAWQPAASATLGAIQAVPERNALRFGHETSAELLAGLEGGHAMRLVFAEWQAGSLEAVLSPVAFRPALREHLRCLAAEDQGSNGDAGDAAAEGARNGAREAARRGGGNTDAQTSQAADATGDASGTIVESPLAGADASTAIHFEHGSARLDRVDFERLRRLARRLRGAGHLSEIVIEGHTDSTGSRNYNQALGLARAIEVRNRLIAEGVAADRLAVRSHGEARPIADNGDRYERSRNRRVDIDSRL